MPFEVRNSTETLETGLSMVKKYLSCMLWLNLGLLAFMPGAFADKDEPEYKTLEWVDLLPESDYDALMNPPSYITEAEDDIFSDSSSRALVIEYGDEFEAEMPLDDPYQQALVSEKVLPEMDGRSVRIPGFIVPLEFDADLTVTEFFLVPYFGACIHMPPPPPNQMIYVTYPKGIKLDALYDPFWISGVLSTDIKISDIGTSAYAMRMHGFENYSY